jgi:hypothetical protein
MSVLSSILTKTVTILQPKDLTGIRKIRPHLMRGCSTL